MAGKNYKRRSMLLVKMILFAIIGSFVGDLFASFLPDFLTKYFEIGFSPTLINLKIINFTIGIYIKVNIMSIIGVVIAFFI